MEQNVSKWTGRLVLRVSTVSEVGVLEQGGEKAMRGASEGQEGAYLVCDGVNVLSGVRRASEGQGGDTGNL